MGREQNRVEDGKTDYGRRTTDDKAQTRRWGDKEKDEI
jgi:hypothetical protein